MQKIPRIIHQIWSGIDGPLPNYFKQLGDTWKRDYPDWEYVLWDNERMNDFVNTYFPQYKNIYFRFPYNVQRWDAIRYLILYKIGGMYVDFDYESIESIERIIENETCCFAEEPLSKRDILNFKRVDKMFNNALMLSTPEHPFMGKILDKVFQEENLLCNDPKAVCVLKTTGPWMLVNTYNELNPFEKANVHLIPVRYVTPFNIDQARRFLSGDRSDELENCLSDAYAVHYFFGGWRKGEK